MTLDFQLSERKKLTLNMNNHSTTNSPEVYKF